MNSIIDRWKDETVVCLASGPSMCREDAEYVKGKARVITVNTTYQLAPWADIHYSSDYDWWQFHIDNMDSMCSGEYWTGHAEYGNANKGREPKPMNVLPYNKLGRGVATSPDEINWGGNSGFCALQIAYKTGASRIVMVGYDQGWVEKKGSVALDDFLVKHWHDDHPAPLRNCNNWTMWSERFGEAAEDFRRLGVGVINCSRQTSLECFDRADLRDII